MTIKSKYRIKVDGQDRVWYQYTNAHTGEKKWWSPFTSEEKLKMAANSMSWNLAKFINIGGIK